MWMSFMLFATIILVLLWLFQFVFLESYYETMKIRDMSRAAQQISKKADYSGLGVAVRKIAFDNSFSVVVTYSADKSGKNEWLGKNLIELNLRKKYGLNIVAIKKDGKVNVNINPELVLDANTALIVIADVNSLAKLK